MRVVGLTGGIACGKTTASSLLKERGIPVIDCDEIAHDIVRKGAWGWRRVVAAFGRDILLPNGEIDREVLGRLVFTNRDLRKRLNAATHLPVALSILWHLVRHWLSFQFVVVVDMPLLFETGAHRLTHPVVVVSCSPKVQLQRLMLRDGCSQEEAEAKVAAQMPLPLKVGWADAVLDNSTDLPHLQSQVEQLVVGGVKRGAWLWGVVLSPAAAALAVATGITAAHRW